MKKLFIILTLAIGLIGCENQKIDFPDYTYTSGYFPYQYPVRTLVLGDYIFPNENDNNHVFLISAAIGGAYENNKDRLFNIALDPTLCTKAKFQTNDTIRLLPQSYYTLSSSTQIIVPAGKFNGDIQVHLTDAFFDDPLAIKLSYVIPLRIVSCTDVDTILRGKTTKTNPDSRITALWDIVPKDYTMFGIKFINPYHGKYLHRGVSVVKDASSTVLQTTTYRQVFPEQNEIWSLVTSSKNSVTISGSIRSTIITGTLLLKLTFDNATGTNGNCTITQGTGSAYTITGTGSFARNTESWGGTLHDAIYLNYQLTSGANTYFATDTLAQRDRAVVMETFTPTVFAK